MNATEQAVLKDLVPLAVYALGIVCPEVPGFIWSSLLGAIINGDISLDSLKKFMEDNGIKTYAENDELNPKLSDFPSGAHSGSL